MIPAGKLNLQESFLLKWFDLQVNVIIWNQVSFVSVRLIPFVLLLNIEFQELVRKYDFFRKKSFWNVCMEKKRDYICTRF